MMNRKTNRFSSPILAKPFHNREANSCRYKAVLFDLDGTLVDTVPHICESYQRTYRLFNLPVLEDAEIMAGIGLPLRDFVEDTVPANLVDDYIKAYRSYNQNEPNKKTAVFWPVKDILENLFKLEIPMGVVTAKMASPAWQNLKDFNLDTYFELLIGHEDTDAHKPDPTPLFVARDKLAKLSGQYFEMHEILYVGDSQFDIACANNAGADAALVQWTRMPLEPIDRAGEYFVLYHAADLH